MTRTRQARPVAIIVIVLGIVMMTTTIAGATRSALRVASIRTEVLSVPAASDITNLQVEVGGSDLEIEFTNGDAAELEVTGPRGGQDWKLQRLGGTLSVTAPSSWNQWRVGVNWGPDGDKAVLRLPASLRAEDARLDAVLDVSVGRVRVDGAFDSLDVTVSIGSAEIEGSARQVTTSVETGSLDMLLSDVDTASLDVDTGSLDGTFTGKQPTAITVQIDTGDGKLKLPAGGYQVSANVTYGDLVNDLTLVSTSKNTVNATVDTGNLTLSS